jgi:putative thioredoxin
MANSPYVHDGTAANFDEQVLQGSRRGPVVVDFWAAWCQPCRVLTPVLEKLAEEFAGRFHLVKINTDEQQALAGQFGIRSLPTVVVFRGGEIVDEFMGAQPESVVRKFLDAHVPRVSDEAREKAGRLHEQGDAEGAIALLRETAQADPDNPRVKYDLARLLIEEGQLEQADEVLHSLPFVQREEEPARGLLTEIQFRKKALESGAVNLDELRQRIADDPGDLVARNQLATQMVVDHDFDAALEQYLEIMKRDRKFEDDAGRRGLLDIFELLEDDDPRLVTYRRRMAGLLN